MQGFSYAVIMCYLVKTSSGAVEPGPGREDAFPNCSLMGCLPCSRTMTPSLTGSQSMLGTSSWLGSRQHSSIRLSSGSWGGPSSRAETQTVEMTSEVKTWTKQTKGP